MVILNSFQDPVLTPWMLELAGGTAYSIWV